MKILLACKRFSQLTGSELYVYELGRCLAERGHVVHIGAFEVGGEIAHRAAEFAEVDTLAGLANVPWEGDGIWRWNEYDVVDASQPETVTYCRATWPNVPLVQTVHGLLDLESPVVDPGVVAYVAVRPAVFDNLPAPVRRHADVIFNPIDFDRFTPEGPADEIEVSTMAFFGSFDWVRASAHRHFVDLGRAWSQRVRLIGAGAPSASPPAHVSVEPPRWDTEVVLRSCTAAGGRIMGRANVEAWACGIPVVTYETDMAGRVVSWEERPPPAPDFMTLFDARRVAVQVERLFERVA